MVAATSTFEIPPERDEITLVSLRKYANELDLRWWERLYLYFVWLPVVRFGFTHMHIAAPSAMAADGRIEFVEQVEVHIEESEAIAACKNDNHSRFSPNRFSYKNLPIRVNLGDASVQYKGHHLPKSVMPDRYRRRTFPAPVPLHQLKELQQTFKTISEKATGI